MIEFLSTTCRPVEGVAAFTVPNSFDYQFFSSKQYFFPPTDLEDIYKDLIIDILLTDFEQ